MQGTGAIEYVPLGIFVSTSGGQVWSLTNAVASFVAISSDSTGQHLIAVANPGYVYVSSSGDSFQSL